MSELWSIREADELDLGGVVALWLGSFGRSGYASRFADERAYWAAHEPRVHRILARAVVRLACDPLAPRVFWAFAAIEGDSVHYVFAKRRFHRQEISADMFRELLGDLLEKPCAYTHELVEFRREEVRKHGLVVPPSWRFDPYLVEAA